MKKMSDGTQGIEEFQHYRPGQAGNGNKSGLYTANGTFIR
jgi:hypothetical protein